MKTVLNVKTDKAVKEEAQALAERIGVPLSTVVNAYLKEFIRTREVRLVVEPRPRREIVKLLKDASRDRRAGRNSSIRFSSDRDMIAHLRGD